MPALFPCEEGIPEELLPRFCPRAVFTQTIPRVPEHSRHCEIEDLFPNFFGSKERIPQIHARKLWQRESRCCSHSFVLPIEVFGQIGRICKERPNRVRCCTCSDVSGRVLLHETISRLEQFPIGVEPAA